MNETAYKNWLFDSVDVSEGAHSFLLDTLWKKEFYSLVNNDDNRAEDGLSLRKKWERRTGQPRNSADFGPPRVLEVIIFLSIRASGILYDGEASVRSRTLFWEFLDNLGLADFENKRFNSTHVAFEVDEILNVWLDRKYQRSGLGGLFPLKSAKKDQRNEEIWYQMNQYLLENYPIL